MNDFAANLATERRTAVRLLLREPLVTAAAHPDEFPLVRRHADELARQFGQVLGYPLLVEPPAVRRETLSAPVAEELTAPDGEAREVVRPAADARDLRAAA